MILDSIFCSSNFINEIIWKRTRTPKAQSIEFGNVHDIILVYSKTTEMYFEKLFKPLSDKRIEQHYSNIEPVTVRRYMLDNFSQADDGPARNFGDIMIKPPLGKHWIWTQEKIDNAWKEKRIIITSGGTPSASFLVMRIDIL